jgi:hypothetical protein
MQCSQYFERPVLSGGLQAMQEAAKQQEEMLRELYFGRNYIPFEQHRNHQLSIMDNEEEGLFSLHCAPDFTICMEEEPFQFLLDTLSPNYSESPNPSEKSIENTELNAQEYETYFSY